MHAVDLEKDVSLASDLAVLADESLGLGFRTGESVLLLLGRLDAVQLLLAHLSELLDLLGRQVGRLDIAVAADDVLEIFQQALVVLSLPLGRHLNQTKRGNEEGRVRKFRD